MKPSTTNAFTLISFGLLASIVFTSCSKEPSYTKQAVDPSIKPLVEPVERPVERLLLADGRDLAVISAASAGDLIVAEMESGEKLVLPETAFSENVHSELPVVDDAELSMPVSTYPRAEWLTYQPSELAWLLRDVSGFGTYDSDKPAGAYVPVIAEDRKIPKKHPDLSRLYYYKNERSYPALLGALSKELPKRLMKLDKRSPLGQIQAVALDVDHEAAVRVAEANVRLAMSNDLPKAINQLAHVYKRTGREELLQELVLAGQYFRSPTSTFISDLQGGLSIKGEDKTSILWGKHQLAVLEGRYADAIKTLKEFSTHVGKKEGASKKEKGLVAEAENRFLRWEKNIKEGLSKKQLTNLEKVFQQNADNIRWEGISLVETLSGKPVAEILDLLTNTVASHGRQSTKATDIILYLIEQRGYDGVEIPVDVLLWGGIYIQGKYSTHRAAPVFALAQKEGATLLNKNPGKIAIRRQFAVEAGIYAMQGMLKHPRVRNRSEVMTTMVELTRHAYQMSAESPKSSKAFGYHYMASGYYISALNITRDAEEVLRVNKQQLEMSPSNLVRQEACIRLGLRNLNAVKDLNLAWDYFERVAKNEFNLNSRWRGFHHLKDVAIQANREQEFLLLAKQALQEKDLGDRNRKSINRLIRELNI